jgi:hypothetical protein
VKAREGVVTFSGLTINKTGNGYTLQLTSSGLNSAVTSGINMTSSGNGIAAAGPPVAGAPDPLLAPLVLDSPDPWIGLGSKKLARRDPT